MPKTMEEQRKGTLEEYLAGKKTVAVATAFPPVWVCEEENAGCWIVGEYLQSEKIHPAGVKKEFLSYTLRLMEFSDNVSFIRSKREYKPAVGEVISVSGGMLERVLDGMAKGTILAIKFLGLGEKKGKNNPPKLYEVTEIVE